jgi:hypothetical protein
MHNKTIKRKRETKKVRSKTMIRYGGKAGKLHKLLYIDEDNSQIVGSGNFGLVVTNNNSVVKLLYDINSCSKLFEEAKIQKKAYKLLQGIVHVPEIYEVFSYVTSYKNRDYLCGIKMEKVPIIEPYRALMHIPLGYKQHDLDTIWTKDYRNPVSEINPPRGYYPSIETLEDEWEEEGIDLTIEKIAYTMGIALRKLVDNGIIPMDLEWIYAGQGKIYLIDFGLCEFGKVDPMSFLMGNSSRTLGVDYYIPGKTHRGRKEFLLGYLGDSHSHSHSLSHSDSQTMNQISSDKYHSET